MKYLRFHTKDGTFTTDLFTSEGPYIGGENEEAERIAVESRKATLERAHGVPLIAVVADADPWDGKGTARALPIKPPAPRVLTLEDRVAALEAAAKR